MKPVLLLVLACAVFLPASALAQPACPGPLAHLLPYAGTYQTDQLFADPAVAAALQRLLGPAVDHLRRNVSVTGTVDLVACNLVISGNAEHQGGLEQGIVAINLVTGAPAAAIQTQGRIEVYVEGTDYFAVPLSIRDWLAVVSTELRYRFELPANARQLPPQGTG